MRTTAFLPLIASLALVACDNTETDDPMATDDPTTTDTTEPSDSPADTDETDTSTTELAQVRVVHASADAPTVDVYAKGNMTPLLEDLAYGDTTAYLELPEGSYDLELRAAGADATSAPAFEQTLAVPASGQITVLAAGSFTSDSSDNDFRLLPLVEGWGADTADSARVRIVHAAATAPTVDLDVGDDGSAELQDVELFADSGAEGVVLPADVNHVGVYLPAGDKVTAFTTPDLPEANLFVIAVGFLEDEPRAETGFDLLAVGPTGTVGFIKQDPVVYALHASPDAPNVDIFAGDAELVSDLGQEELSAKIQVPPGAYTLDFFGADTGTSTRPGGDAAASATTPTLMAGEEYLAIAAGYLTAGNKTDPGDPDFQLVAVADGFDLDATGPSIRAIHAAADVGTVDVGTVSEGVLTPAFDDVPFGGASAAAGLELVEGNYVFGVAAPDSTTPIVSWGGAGLSLVDGDRFFTIPSLETADGVPLLLVDVTVSPWSVTSVAIDD